MEGSIIKRGKTYTIRYDIGRDINGKRMQKSIGGFKTKAEAQKSLNERLFKLQKGEFFTDENISFRNYLLNNWIPNYCISHLKGKTIENYKFVINQYIVPNLGNIKLNKLTAKDLDFLYNKLQNSLGLSGTTCLNCHLVIHKSLKTAVKWQIISKNVADFADRPKKSTVKMIALEIDQVKILLNALKNTSIYIFALLAFTTGMRRGELLGLTWEDIDLDNGTIKITKQLQKLNGELLFTTPKSIKSIRTITIPENIVNILKQENLRQSDKKKFMGSEYHDNNLVICEEDGKPYDPDYITHNFSRKMNIISKKFNIPKIRLHDMRHTHATLLLKAGANIVAVSSRLGHEKVSTTLNLYSHLLPSMQQEATNILNEMNLE